MGAGVTCSGDAEEIAARGEFITLTKFSERTIGAGAKKVQMPEGAREHR